MNLFGFTTSMFAVDSLLVCSKVWLVRFVDEVSFFCFGIFDIWSKLACILKKVKKIQPGEIRDPNRSKGGPQRFRTTCCKNNVPQRERFKQVVQKWDPKSETWSYFR